MPIQKFNPISHRHRFAEAKCKVKPRVNPTLTLTKSPLTVTKCDPTRTLREGKKKRGFLMTILHSPQHGLFEFLSLERVTKFTFHFALFSRFYTHIRSLCRRSEISADPSARQFISYWLSIFTLLNATSQFEELQKVCLAGQKESKSFDKKLCSRIPQFSIHVQVMKHFSLRSREPTQYRSYHVHARRPFTLFRAHTLSNKQL